MLPTTQSVPGAADTQILLTSGVPDLTVRVNRGGLSRYGFNVSDVEQAVGDYGGQFENQERATKRPAIIIPIVILLIFGLLYLTFKSVKQSLLVIGNIPFALVGGIAALWLRGMNLNLSASVGFIALFGVAILNGVVLVSSINQAREGGWTLNLRCCFGACVARTTAGSDDGVCCQLWPHSDGFVGLDRSRGTAPACHRSHWRPLQVAPAHSSASSGSL